MSWIFWHHYWSRKKGLFIDGPYAYRNRMMKRCCEEAGVKHFNFHHIRHAGASMMANDNVPIRVIQDILGHEHRTTTEIYIKSLKGTRHKAIDGYAKRRK